MKFHTLGHAHGQSIKDQIIKEFRKEGFISYGAVREAAGEFAHRDDFQIGWDDDSDLDRRIRVRETKKGWFIYLPEPNAIIKIGEGKDVEQTPLIGDVCVFETEIFEKLIDEIVKLRSSLNSNFADIIFTIDNGSGFCYRYCIVKAKKSGRKEERQDRPAKFHRWVDLSKGVQQVVALVEFEDGHVEQVQPDRIIFQEVKENE